MKGPQQRQFDICFDGHVVLNCVQRSQYQVEDADSIPQFWWESLYDCSTSDNVKFIVDDLQDSMVLQYDGQDFQVTSLASIRHEGMGSMAVQRTFWIRD